LEDLLWARLPAMRVLLMKTVAEELERAIEMDRVLWRLSPYGTCGTFMDDLFRPALEGLPDTAEAAKACCDVLREVVDLDLTLGGTYQDALYHMVLGWLADTYNSELGAVDPGLAAVVGEWAAAPEPPPGPAAVVGGRGADAGGNPLRVPDAAVGWGWVEVEAGPDRVAVLRYGGIGSWALLNLAPEPAETPMDLGLGPLADLVWAGLPAARPALSKLVLRELDAAVLDDRMPAAVPGVAVVALIEPAARSALRDPPGLAARRCCRVLGRLMEVDSRLTGWHRGRVAESLGWLTRSPHRSVVSSVDPDLLDRVDRRPPS